MQWSPQPPPGGIHPRANLPAPTPNTPEAASTVVGWPPLWGGGWEGGGSKLPQHAEPFDGRVRAVTSRQRLVQACRAARQQTLRLLH